MGELFLMYFPKVSLTKALWSRESIIFATGHGLLPSYLIKFRLHHSDNCSYGYMGDLLHYATCCHLTSSFHFTQLSTENTLIWFKNLLLNKLSRIKIAKLISFLTDNEDLQMSNRKQSAHPTPIQISLLYQDFRLMDHVMFFLPASTVPTRTESSTFHFSRRPQASCTW
ncbi:hypothetical protein AVEN_77753-1 [Araneus ventricosus]|uniref:Uncharacterized protein n=1 Tax=Araneus ventricosus TaxID=182803 RepID=A0A4Y2RIA6_ARAVE|nr:hypothetical protein AVEN_77753-1 [Araneus ventricosus]